MAEIGLTASIVGIISCTSVLRGLHTLAQDAGSAKAEIQSYSNEVSGLVDLLTQADTIVKLVGDTKEDPHPQTVVDTCGRVLRPLRKMQRTLNIYQTRLKNHASSLKKFAVLIKWVLTAKKKVLFFRSSVRAQHQILDTALSLINLRTGISERATQNLKM